MAGKIDDEMNIIIIIIDAHSYVPTHYTTFETKKIKQRVPNPNLIKP